MSELGESEYEKKSSRVKEINLTLKSGKILSKHIIMLQQEKEQLNKEIKNAHRERYKRQVQ